MVRVGIIGCGSISKLRHVREYAKNPNAQIVGYYDHLHNRAKALASLYGGKVYGSCRQLLDDPSIDAVSVCTSNDTHAEITLEALAKGKHVLCEKPMAMTEEDCAAMVKAAESSGKYLMIGHNQRLAPAHRKAKSILDSGELGHIISFSTTFGHRGPEYWSMDKNTNTWFFKKDAAILGVMADLGIHKMDIIQWLVGSRLSQVCAMIGTLDKKDGRGNPIEVDDNAVCLLRFDNGATGTLTVSWTYYGDEDNSTVLYCSNGTMKIYGSPDYPIEIVKNNGERVYYKMDRIQSNDGAQQENSGVIDMFIQSIIDKHQPEISVHDAYTSMKAVFACFESAQTGKIVRL